MSQSYRPMIDEYDAWGKVDDEHKSDFVSEMGSFITNINEAVVSFANGLELRGPDPKIMKSIESRGNRIGLSSESIDHFEKLLTIRDVLQYPADSHDILCTPLIKLSMGPYFGHLTLFQARCGRYVGDVLDVIQKLFEVTTSTI